MNHACRLAASAAIVPAWSCGSSPAPAPVQPANIPAGQEAGACNASCFFIEELCVIQLSTPTTFVDCPGRCCAAAEKYPDPDRAWIMGKYDKCSTQPEDFDGSEDMDGCPDPDYDMDGIIDLEDLCPNDPEDKDGAKDTDGCPDP